MTCTLALLRPLHEVVGAASSSGAVSLFIPSAQDYALDSHVLLPDSEILAACAGSGLAAIVVWLTWSARANGWYPRGCLPDVAGIRYGLASCMVSTGLASIIVSSALVQDLPLVPALFCWQWSVSARQVGVRRGSLALAKVCDALHCRVTG